MLTFILNLQPFRARWLTDRRAVTAIEYALIAALIAVVIIGAVSGLGKGVQNTFNKVASEL
jgi:pilus assembly protein Flp/PilA